MKSSKKDPSVLVTTSEGNFKIALFLDKAPLSVKNFLSYIKDGHYIHTIFHRVIENFMIQGGGFTKDMKQKPTQEPIKNEAANGLSNIRGTLAMARTGEVHSATSQFFINVVDNYFLDHKGENPRDFGYCVFGQVIEGMDVVDKIKEVQTESKGHYHDVPKKPIEILKMSIIKK